MLNIHLFSFLSATFDRIAEINFNLDADDNSVSASVSLTLLLKNCLTTTANGASTAVVFLFKQQCHEKLKYEFLCLIIAVAETCTHKLIKGKHERKSDPNYKSHNFNAKVTTQLQKPHNSNTATMELSNH